MSNINTYCGCTGESHYELIFQLVATIVVICLRGRISIDIHDENLSTSKPSSQILFFRFYSLLYRD